MAGSLSSWLAKLNNARYPVMGALKKSVDALPKTAGNHDWVSLYQKDPMLSAMVFREIGRYREAVDSLEQSPGLLGPDRFQQLAHQSRLEETLQGGALVAYLQSIKRSNVVAHIAYQWSRTKGYQQPSQFYHAAQLLHIGELAIRVVAPETAQQVDRQLDPGSGWNGQEIKVLKTTQQEIAKALARDWKLPDLLRQSLSKNAPRHPRARLVVLADKAFELCSRDPGANKLQTLLEQVAEGGSDSLDTLRRDIFKAAVSASREFNQCYPIKAESGRRIMLYPQPFAWPKTKPGAVEKPVAKTSPAAPPPVVEIKPDPYPTATPGPKPATRPDPPVVNAHTLIQHALDRISVLSGVERTIFSVITQDRKNIKGRYWHGVDDKSPLRRYLVKRDSGNLFASLLKEAAKVRIYSGNREKYKRYFDAESRHLFGEVSLLAGSIFIRNKPLGVLYADDGGAKQEISLESFQHFKHILDDLRIKLEAL